MTARTRSPQIPASVEIGPYTFAVVTDQPALMEASRKECEPLDGYYTPGTQRILVNADAAPGSVRYTTLHEILHALLDITGYAKEWAKEDDAEELFVVRFTPALLDLLRANPELIAFLVAS